MPGLSGSYHHGAKRHVRLAAETTYGVAGSSWTDVPLIGNGMTLKATSEPWEPDSNIFGGVDDALHIQHKQDVEGDLVTALWPQILQTLLDAALSRSGTEDDLTSYTLDHYTPADPRRILGCVVRSMRLEVDGTEGSAQISISWLGQEEEENAALGEDDFDYTGIDQRPFMSGDATLQLDAVDVYSIETFTLTVENEIKVGPYRPKGGATHRVISHALAGRRRVTLELTKTLQNADLNTHLRAGTTGSFELDMIHPLGHRFQLQLPRLIVTQSEEDGTPSQVATESPQMLAVGGTAGESAIEYSVDLASDGTTTMEPLTTTAGA